MLVELNKKFWMKAIIVLFVLIAGAFYFFLSRPGAEEGRAEEVAEESAEVSDDRDVSDESGSASAKEEADLSAAPESEAPPSQIVVHVSGAVKNPDTVYSLPEGSRVMDAVAAAGGAADKADLSQLNLAKLLTDGEKIRVPLEGEILEEEEAPPEAAPAAGEGKKEQNPLTNINLATTIELQELPGIGKVYAERIVEYREANGQFQTIEDIMNVSGIGESTFAKIKDRITVSP